MPDGKKRKRLSLGEKVEAVAMLGTGRSAVDVMNHLGIRERTVRKLKSDTEAIINIADERGIPLHTKSARPPKFAEIEEHVLRFIRLARIAKVSVTQDIISRRALLARKKIIDQARPGVDLDAVKKFTASIGWVSKFVKRHELNSVVLHGRGGSAEVAGAAQDIVKLRQRLSEFEAVNIYNVDETGLFYKLLPKRSYVLRSEEKKTLRGVKHMKAKDRITAYVCTNADGHGLRL